MHRQPGANSRVGAGREGLLMHAVPNDWKAMQDVYNEAVDDLDKLLDYARGFEVDVVSHDGADRNSGGYFEMGLSTAVTGALLPSSWDRLSLITTLGVAIARLVAQEADHG